MKYRNRINNLYNIVLFNDRFNTPYFIIYDNGYYVYKTTNDKKNLFKTLNDAILYIKNICNDPIIINMDFREIKND